MRLLLLSNSASPGEIYLEYAKSEIRKFLGKKPVTALFIPYAAVTFSFDDYEKKVQASFREIGHQINSIHHFDDPVLAVENAEAIIIGGGNTWHLLHLLQKNKLIEVIRKKVLSGKPYIGWSAGSNVTCPTIRTTNDMPVVIPESGNALNLIPFQINPHYLDKNPEGFGGESREDRINEFIVINPELYVVGLREGTMLFIDNQNIKLIGNKPARIFRKGFEPLELKENDDFGFLMKMI